MCKIKEALLAYVKSQSTNEFEFRAELDEIEFKTNILFNHFVLNSQGIKTKVFGRFDEHAFRILWFNIKSGFQIIGEFSEYENQIYCYDVNGNKVKDILFSYNAKPSIANNAPYWNEQIPSDNIKMVAKLRYDNELVNNEANFKGELLERANERSKEAYENELKKITDNHSNKRAVINPMILFRELNQFSEWVKDNIDKSNAVAIFEPKNASETLKLLSELNYMPRDTLDNISKEVVRILKDESHPIHKIISIDKKYVKEWTTYRKEISNYNSIIYNHKFNEFLRKLTKIT